MGIKPTPENNALLACPEIAERWNWEKNDKGPEDYTRQSGQRVWLKCSKCKQSVEHQVYNAVKKPKVEQGRAGGFKT